jgi:hypothetical protein
LVYFFPSAVLGNAATDTLDLAGRSSAVGRVGRAAAGLRVEEASAGSVAVAEVLAAVARVRDGKAMRTKEFLSKLEPDRILAAIRSAESQPSRQLRVNVHHA